MTKLYAVPDIEEDAVDDETGEGAPADDAIDPLGGNEPEEPPRLTVKERLRVAAGKLRDPKLQRGFMFMVIGAGLSMVKTILEEHEQRLEDLETWKGIGHPPGSHAASDTELRAAVAHTGLALRAVSEEAGLDPDSLSRRMARLSEEPVGPSETPEEGAGADTATDNAPGAAAGALGPLEPGGGAVG